MGQIVFIRGGETHQMKGNPYLALHGDLFFIVNMENPKGTQKIICVNPLKYPQNFIASEIVRRFVGINEPIELVLRSKQYTQITETRFKILGAVEETTEGEVTTALIVEVEPV